MSQTPLDAFDDATQNRLRHLQRRVAAERAERFEHPVDPAGVQALMLRVAREADIHSATYHGAYAATTCLLSLTNIGYPPERLMRCRALNLPARERRNLREAYLAQIWWQFAREWMAAAARAKDATELRLLVTWRVAPYAASAFDSADMASLVRHLAADLLRLPVGYQREYLETVEVVEDERAPGYDLAVWRVDARSFQEGA
jgi:hypothetical protein